MDRDELDLVRASMREVLAATEPSRLPAELLAGGWAELVDSDPAAAMGILADEQGRSLTAAPSLDLVLLHGAGRQIDAETAVVLPPLHHRPLPSGRLGDGRLCIDGLVLAGHERASTFVVVTEAGLVAVPAGSVDLERIDGSDPDLGLCRASGVVALATAAIGEPPSAWTNAQSAGRRFLASELLGLAGRMLDDTVAYVLERRQFGRPIAAFQSVKHRLADVRVAIGAARAGLATAWDDGSELSAIAAKCLAGRAHRVAATHGHQVHGGIAFTVEHGFHRLIRRGQLLDSLLGRADDLVVELGRELLRGGRLPRTPELQGAS